MSECIALVITFTISICGDENFFGWVLSPVARRFSVPDYATKIAVAGVYFKDYDRHTFTPPDGYKRVLLFAETEGNALLPGGVRGGAAAARRPRGPRGAVRPRAESAAFPPFRAVIVIFSGKFATPLAEGGQDLVYYALVRPEGRARSLKTGSWRLRRITTRNESEKKVSC